MNPATSVLILCDVQNDFLYRDSAYGRVGVSSAAVATLPERFTPGMRRPRAASFAVAMLFVLDAEPRANNFAAA